MAGLVPAIPIFRPPCRLCAQNPRQGEGRQKPRDGDEPGEFVGGLEGLRHHGIGQHGEDRPGGDGRHERDGGGSGPGKDRVADERRDPGGQRDADPDAEDIDFGAPGPAHPGGAGEPLRQVGEKHRRHGHQAHPLAGEKAHADDDGFRDAVEQCPEGDGEPAPLLAAMRLPGILRSARALAVLGAPARHEDVRPRIDRRARQEAQRRGENAARAIGLVHEVEGQGRDQHARPERHHGRDGPLRQLCEISDERPQHQGRPAEQAPKARLDGKRHGLFSYGQGERGGRRWGSVMHSRTS